ncbi:hypothetical protein Bbelb_119860 [Branchiostoma belcheri]|nr:hypothetical protein Bbelb_119860 [Branchiostoma belcheri]
MSPGLDRCAGASPVRCDSCSPGPTHEGLHGGILAGRHSDTVTHEDLHGGILAERHESTAPERTLSVSVTPDMTSLRYAGFKLHLACSLAGPLRFPGLSCIAGPPRIYTNCREIQFLSDAGQVLLRPGRHKTAGRQVFVERENEVLRTDRNAEALLAFPVQSCKRPATLPSHFLASLAMIP